MGDDVVFYFIKHHGLKGLAGVLVILIGFELITGIQSSTQLNQAPVLNVAPVIKIRKAAGVPTAAKVQLFGEYLPNEVGAAGVKRSGLNISVVGIVFSSDEAKSHVMLELSDHQVKLFVVGDKIPGGAVLKRITPEGILLMRDGVMEGLSLPKNDVLFSPPPAALQSDDK
jgi:general secretion pathway protein C